MSNYLFTDDHVKALAGSDVSVGPEIGVYSGNNLSTCTNAANFSQDCGGGTYGNAALVQGLISPIAATFSYQ